MANYPTLRSGSSGDEVKKLQQSLENAGYSVGSAGVDGIYGSNTANAVRQYQKDNGLAVDGIAGEQTLGKLYGGSAVSTTESNTGASAAADSGNIQTTMPDYSKYQYDPTTNEEYTQALAVLQQAQDNMPTYAGTYDAKLEDTYNQIVNREKFSYDLNSDALYQQYKDQYVQQGKLAMMDTMGQAAALTGGYGNSYASAAGSQAYQAYLQQLNDVVPELYGMALDQYNQEGQDLLNQYSMLGDLSDTEYGRYLDALNQYRQNVTFAKEQADEAYNQDYNNWHNAQQVGIDAENTAYSKQQAAKENLVTLIATTGYTPTAEELSAAGMSAAQAQSWQNYYNKTEAAASTSTKKTSVSSNSSDAGAVGEDNGGYGYDNGSLTKDQVKALQAALGVNDDGLYGSQSKKAAGGLSADEAYAKFVGDTQPDFTSFDGNDWYSYFNDIRVNDSPAEAEAELNELMGKSLIPAEYALLAASAARGGTFGH